MAEFKSNGRIVYIEPNNILNQGDNVFSNLEDYGIAIDLRVAVPNRYDCGTVKYGYNDIATAITTNYGSQESFLGGSNVNNYNSGEKKMLTTSYTDISYISLVDGKIDKETLGIDTIDIEFDAHFYPIVTIKFIDVRAFSLFMPQEIAYKAMLELEKEQGSGTPISYSKGGSFFRALFSYPYPIFYLTVKGFYGNPVTFKLLVDTFSGDFNSNTGNFEVVVKFIGYMYRAYADIPAKAIIVAPYDTYAGNAYWNTKNFTFDNGYPIPKFVDFIKKVSDVADDLKNNELTKSNINDIQRIEEQVSALDEISSLFVTYTDSIGDGKKIYGNSNVIVLTNSNQVTGNTKTFNSLKSAIDAYNDTYGLNSIVLPNNGEPNSNQDDIIYSTTEIYKKSSDGKPLVLYKDARTNPLKEIGERIEKDTTLNATLSTLEAQSWGKNGINATNCFLYKTDEFNTKILELKDNLNNVKNKLYESTSDSVNNIGANALGFKPTVENIFKMFYAYLDTYMESLYSCVNAVNTNMSARSCNTLGIDVSTTDVKGTDSNIQLPPFPGFSKEDSFQGDDVNKAYNSVVDAYPGDIPQVSNIEEVSLVNGFLNGIKDCIEQNTRIQQAAISKTQNDCFIPINLSDYISNINPYKYVFGDNGGEKIDRLMSNFGVRLMNYISLYNMASHNKGKDSVLFGQAEAYNFFYSNEYDEDLMQKLMSNDCSGEAFFNFLAQPNRVQVIYNRENNIPVYKINHSNDKMIDLLTVNGLRSYYQYEWLTSSDDTYEAKYYPTSFKNIGDISSNIKNNLSLTDISTRNNSSYVVTIKRNNEKANIDPLIDNYDITNNYIFNIFNDNNIESLIKNIKQQDLQYIENIDNIFNNINYKLDENYVNYYDKGELIAFKKGEDAAYNKDKNAIPKTYSWDDQYYVSNDGKGPKNFQPYSNAVSFIKSRYEKELCTTKEIIRSIISNDDISEYCIPNVKFGDNYSLYGSAFFYLQNNDSDSTNRLVRKALLFLFSFYSNDKNIFKAFYKTVTENNGINRIPQIWLLLIGGILWREKYYKNNNKDIFIYNNIFESPEDFIKYIPVNSIPNSTKKNFILIQDLFDADLKLMRIEVRNKLIKYFEQWVYTDFKYINDSLEIQIKKIGKDGKEGLIPLNYDSFINLSNILIMCVKNSLNNNAVGNAFITYFKELYEKLTNKQLRDRTESEAPYNIYDVLGILSDNVFENYQEISTNKGLFNIGDPEKTIYLMLREDSNANKNILKLLTNSTLVYTQRTSDSAESDSDYVSYFSQSTVEKSFNAFKSTLIKLYDAKNKKAISDKKTPQIENELDSSFKKSMYYDFKRLYDRWIASNKREIWSLDSAESEFKDIVYVDSFKANIGDKFLMNVDKVAELLMQLQKDPEYDPSVYDVLNRLANDNKLLFMALPMGNPYDNEESMKDMFTPIPFNEIKAPNESSKYFVMYPNIPSYLPDIGNEIGAYKYTNDGFDMADTLGEINIAAPEEFFSDMNSGQIVPAFGVTYGMQNQNFFTNIKIKLDNPRLTEYAIANTLMISEAFKGESTSKKEPLAIAQDMYSIYSNYSFTCNVDMMGCAQIMPTMYFQLNNVPMIKGAYIITKVTHHIEAGNMTTSFEGVRQRKTNIPLNKNIFNIKSMLEYISSNENEENIYTSNTPIRTETVHLNLDQFKPTYQIPTNAGNDHENQDTWYDYFINLKDKQGRSLVKFDEHGITYRNGAADAVNESQEELCKLLDLIAKTIDMNDLNFGIYVTSMKRNWSNRSEHKIGYAMDIHGCPYDSNGNLITNEKMHSKSAELFYLIGTSFTPYIRQLIWEDKFSDTYSLYADDSVGNCIHVSTRGFNKNDKLEIFQQYILNGQVKTILVDEGIRSVDSPDYCFYPLSKVFLKTCATIISNDKLGVTMNNINNFRKSGLTNEVYRDKLLEMFNL